MSSVVMKSSATVRADRAPLVVVVVVVRLTRVRYLFIIFKANVMAPLNMRHFALFFIFTQQDPGWRKVVPLGNSTEKLALRSSLAKDNR